MVPCSARGTLPSAAPAGRPTRPDGRRSVAAAGRGGSRSATDRIGGTGFAIRRGRMTSATEESPVHDNPARRRYEKEIDGKTAMIVYRLHGDTITFTHTEVPPEFEGRGIAARMAHFALEDARARGLRVVPLCPYVAAYIRRHPEYQPLVAPEHSSQ